MDRQEVTSPGVVKISRLASRLRRSARRKPDPTAVLASQEMKSILGDENASGEVKHCLGR